MCIRFLLAIPFFILPFVAEAATFEAGGERSSRHGYSQIVRMTGPIETGDVARLVDVVAALPSGSRESFVQVSLDSPGGEFDEALALARHIAAKGFTTLVEANATCLSGCALAFMAGRAYGEDTWWPRRTLEPGGTVGFHAPFVFDAEDDGIAPEVARLLLPNAERAAALAAAEMVQLSLDGVLPVSLTRELLTIDSRNFLYIRTIDQIGRWKIELAGSEAMKTPQSIEPDLLRQAAKRFCTNYVLWRLDVAYSDRPPPDALGGLGQVALQTRCVTELNDGVYRYSYQHYDTGERDQGPVLFWQTLAPTRELGSLTAEEVSGPYNFRAPFDPRDEPPSQVDGACIQGFQWTGGWLGFAWQDGQAHATFRSCDGRGRPFHMTCDHGSKSVRLVVDARYLPNGITDEVMKIRVDDQVFPAALGQIQDLNGLSSYVANYGRSHPLFVAMRTGRLISFQISDTDLTLHLADAESVLTNFEASCL